MARRLRLLEIFAVIPIVMSLLLFPPFSAMGKEETTTSSSSSSSITTNTNTETNTNIDTSTTGVEADVQLSGKIASSRINLDNGTVEQVLFGNWSADVRSISDAGFDANFSASNISASNNSSNSEEDAHYRIGNLTLNSFQRVNEHVALGGTVDVVEENEAQTWEESPVTILLINETAIVISFEEQELNEVFSSQPIVGVVVAAPE